MREEAMVLSIEVVGWVMREETMVLSIEVGGGEITMVDRQ